MSNCHVILYFKFSVLAHENIQQHLCNFPRWKPSTGLECLVWPEASRKWQACICWSPMRVWMGPCFTEQRCNQGTLSLDIIQLTLVGVLENYKNFFDVLTNYRQIWIFYLVALMCTCWIVVPGTELIKLLCSVSVLSLTFSLFTLSQNTNHRSISASVCVSTVPEEAEGVFCVRISRSKCVFGLAASVQMRWDALSRWLCFLRLCVAHLVRQTGEGSVLWEQLEAFQHHTSYGVFQRNHISTCPLWTDFAEFNVQSSQ